MTMETRTPQPRKLCKLGAQKGAPRDDDLPAYQDVCMDSDIPREPRILKDGTSVRWPRGWTLEQAAEWRRANNLESPEARRARFKVVGP